MPSGAAATPGPAAESSPAGGAAAESLPAGDPAAESSPAGGPTAAAGSPLSAVDSKEDGHWIQADDYFVSQRAFERGWLRVQLAKMKQPAPAGAKGEALFFMINDGSERRSAHFYRTRPAVQADLALGNLLVCFEDNRRDKVYRAPRDKDEARPGRWYLARITDLSDLAKGYATLSGQYHCAPDALRAVVQ
jgi:hypothetical protein